MAVMLNSLRSRNNTLTGDWLKDFTLIEVSFEVANKVGGIYTVIVSKMSYAIANSKEYFAIGPCIGRLPKEFSEEKPPGRMSESFAELEKNHGIKCHYGTWLIEKNPKAILIDYRGLSVKSDDIKRELWEKYQIDSWGTDNWFNEPTVWAKAAGYLIQSLNEKGVFRYSPVAHFHEWLSAPAMLHLKSAGMNIPSVFTTHSTVLGRAVAETGRENLYDIINTWKKNGTTAPVEKAYEYGVHPKHLMEKAAAASADVFTTVSEIMGKECQYVLGRKPDVILPNGLDMKKFPQHEKIPEMYRKYTDNIRDFLLGYFLPYYEVDTDNAMLCFISGRHEFRNKGIDIFIDSLAGLNDRLRKSRSKKMVFAFIFVPAETAGTKPTVLEHLSAFGDAERLIEKATEKVEKNVLRDFIHGNKSETKVMLDAAFLRKLEKLGKKLKGMRKGIPPVTPFQMKSENNIIHALRDAGLDNSKDDRVKIVYYPAYLSEKDGLLELAYYNAMIGFDAGVFPSYYESWGYTPLEAAALGLHSVTTDLSGYGKFIETHLRPSETSISVVKRDGKSDTAAAKELEDILYRITMMKPSDSRKERERAKSLSFLADWGTLFENYLKAYALLLERA